MILSILNSDGDVVAYSEIDDEDYPKISDLNLSLSSRGYVQTRVDGKRTSIHRIIMNAPDNMQVDHINMNRLDNRKVNLRLCSKSENKANINKLSTNTSGYKGVWWHKRIQKWQAGIKVNQKSVHLGYFESVSEAAQAYNNAASEFFGKFARLNNLGE